MTLNDPDDWNDHIDMLDYGFEQLEQVDLSSAVHMPNAIPTVSSDGVTLGLALTKTSIVKLKNDDLSYNIDIPSYIASDVKSGDKIGELILKIGKSTETIDIIATNDVKIKRTSRRFL